MRRNAALIAACALSGLTLSACGSQPKADPTEPVPVDPRVAQFEVLADDMAQVLPTIWENQETAFNDTVIGQWSHEQIVALTKGYTFHDGVTLAQFNTAPGMVFCLTGPEDSYATLTIDDSTEVIRRTFGTGMGNQSCDYEDGDVVIEATDEDETGSDSGSSLGDTLISDAKNLATLVETWLTDNPTTPVVIDNKFLTEYSGLGVSLSTPDVTVIQTKTGTAAEPLVYAFCILGGDKLTYVGYDSISGVSEVGTDGSCGPLPADPGSNGGPTGEEAALAGDFNGKAIKGAALAEQIKGLDEFGKVLAGPRR